MNEPDYTLSYEATRDAVEQLQPAATEDDRTLVWLDGAHIVAVARDVRGRIEIFVVCEPIAPSDKLVSENLQHQVWQTSTGEPLPANRLVLPGAAYFDGVAAFICAELTENGVVQDPAGAFRRSEPVIALALRRVVMSNQALVGLAGELFVIGRLVEALPERAAPVVAGWYGSAPSTRDLQLGPIGVEIKTTTGSASVHHIQGFHQIELGVSVDATPETHLFLLSVGIDWLPARANVGRSIPELVDSILKALAGADLQDAFLSRLKQYGGDAAIGYDHLSQRDSPRYARRFQARFERLYDVTDERLHLLRRQDAAGAVDVDIDSINFRVSLPDKVRGDLNPVTGMSAVVARLNQLAWE